MSVCWKPAWCECPACGPLVEVPETSGGGAVTANRRVDFPPGTRVMRSGDSLPGTVVEQPPGERVVVWWDSGTRTKHSIRQLRKAST